MTCCRGAGTRRGDNVTEIAADGSAEGLALVLRTRLADGRRAGNGSGIASDGLGIAS